MRKRALTALTVALLLVACGGDAAESPSIDRTLAYDDIDPAIYFADSAGEDPFADVYEGFRERKAAAQSDPDMPPPIAPHPTVHRSRDMDWTPVEEVLHFDWQRLDRDAPEEAAALRAALRLKRVFDHPDLEIVQVLLGAGALLPAHAEGAPGVLLALEGEATVVVNEEAQRVTSGAKIKLEPYAVREIQAAEQAPFKALWIRWAPHGDHRYITAGYYLTGANQHVQPEEALVPTDFQFWGGSFENAKAEAPDRASEAGSWVAEQWAALEEQRRQIGAAELELYGAVPVFGHESATPWLDVEAIRNSNFMWAKDVLSTGALLDRWAEVVRMEGLFQARYEDGSWDFNISQQAWGSGSRYVEHSHSIPEFYYMLSGRVRHWNGDQPYDAEPGDVFMTNSFQNHESRVYPDGEIWRSYGATWAPNGDRTVFDRPHFLLASLPTQAVSAALADDVAFH